MHLGLGYLKRNIVTSVKVYVYSLNYQIAHTATTQHFCSALSGYLKSKVYYSIEEFETSYLKIIENYVCCLIIVIHTFACIKILT